MNRTGFLLNMCNTHEYSLVSTNPIGAEMGPILIERNKDERGAMPRSRLLSQSGKIRSVRLLTYGPGGEVLTTRTNTG